jgi:hypothetical protein
MTGLWRAPTGEQLRSGMPRPLRAAIYAGVAVVLLAGSFVAVQLVG